MPNSTLPRTRRYSFRSRPNASGAARPISDLNITPLIDVLLVLLVMIMLSIPIATHSVKVDIPPPGPGTGNPPVINTLHLNSAGVTFWNEEAVDDAKLTSLLKAMARDPQQPALHMQTDTTARYERFDQIIAMVKRASVTKMGFVGNEQFASWDNMD